MHFLSARPLPTIFSIKQSCLFLGEVKTWHPQSLDKLCPIVYFGALMIKVQEDGKVINKAFYLALGVNKDGQNELLGIWLSENEDAKFFVESFNRITR